MSSIRPQRAPFRLADLGVYGFDRHETTILASLVTEDPLLLVGRSGTGKTFLLNTLSEALGLEHRHYNASLISFDDLVGFPYPDEAHTTVRFLETPATVWGAESVLIDEISRCKPEHQNRLFSLVHERRCRACRSSELRYRWAAMNPCTSDQAAREDYSAPSRSTPRSRTASRSSSPRPTGATSPRTRSSRRSSTPSGEGMVTPRNDGAVRRESALARAVRRAGRTPAREQVTTLRHDGRERAERRPASASRRDGRGCSPGASSPRPSSRAAPRRGTFKSVLECSLPHSTLGRRPSNARSIAAAHRAGWDALARDERRLDPRVPHRAEPAAQARRCCSTTAATRTQGSQAIAQLHRQRDRPDRAAAFAFATYPRPRSGQLPIGAEGVNDLAKLAVPLLDAEGELSWQERLSEKGTSHPVIASIGQGAGSARGTRASRGRGSSSRPAWCAASRCRRRPRSSRSSTSA